MTSEYLSSGYPMTYSPSPSASHSPHISGIRSIFSAVSAQEKYLSMLLAERHKLGPFLLVLPNCHQLLNQEILRVTALLSSASTIEQNRLEHGAADMKGWALGFQPDRPAFLHPPRGSSSGLIVKKSFRVDVPVDTYPTYNFMGRLLGPRGNSLKRLEASTDCRVMIRGRGSVKDVVWEEMMRGKPGNEHLNEPLHILVEAELPAEVIDSRLMQACEILQGLLKPMEAHDFFKKQQLRELTILNGALRDESADVAFGSFSPFDGNLGLKRATTMV